jgi:hypothetical protein
MSDWPVQVLRSTARQNIIAAGGPLIGARDLTETAASGTWPTANVARFYPYISDEWRLVTQMWCHNGTAVAGKIDMGIYDAGRGRLVNKGLTTQEGVSTLQVLNIADTWLEPGALYYFAITCTSITAQFIRGTAGAANRQRGAGCAQQNLGSELELPATATFAVIESSFVPLFGASVSRKAVV